MALKVTLGSPEAGKVKLRIVSHSSVNGADFAAGATFAVTSNDPTVATADVSAIPPLTPGVQSFDLPVTVLKEGSTDFHVVETDGAGNTYEGTDTLEVQPAPAPGQTRIEVSLVVVP